jgi:hypothetical protein
MATETMQAADSMDLVIPLVKRKDPPRPIPLRRRKQQRPIPLVRRKPRPISSDRLEAAWFAQSEEISQMDGEQLCQQNPADRQRLLEEQAKELTREALDRWSLGG